MKYLFIFLMAAGLWICIIYSVFCIFYVSDRKSGKILKLLIILSNILLIFLFMILLTKFLISQV